MTSVGFRSFTRTPSTDETIPPFGSRSSALTLASSQLQWSSPSLNSRCTSKKVGRPSRHSGTGWPSRRTLFPWHLNHRRLLHQGHLSRHHLHRRMTLMKGRAIAGDAFQGLWAPPSMRAPLGPPLGPLCMRDWVALPREATLVGEPMWPPYLNQWRVMMPLQRQGRGWHMALASRHYARPLMTLRRK
jgi:hypothetical protein